MNVVVPWCFASRRLLRAMYSTLHVLGLSNMNVVVPWCLASHRLLDAMCWTFHGVGLPNLNVVVTLHSCERISTL